MEECQLKLSNRRNLTREFKYSTCESSLLFIIEAACKRVHTHTHTHSVTHTHERARGNVYYANEGG